jgi:hypothetical protein
MIWLAATIWNVFLIGGCVWLIAERGWSYWWILLAVFLLSSPKQRSEKE